MHSSFSLLGLPVVGVWFMLHGFVVAGFSACPFLSGWSLPLSLGVGEGGDWAWMEELLAFASFSLHVIGWLVGL